MTRNIVVTGGAGYVGSHVCKALSRAGYVPITLDNLSRGFRDAVKWGPLAEVDLNDTAEVSAVVATHRPGAVIHMAGYINVGESVDHPERYHRNNVDATISLLDAMVGAGTKNIVFSSSCAVYGTPERVPMDETLPLGPESPYGATKQMAEQIIADYGRAHGVSHLALRYFNAAGADPDGEIGENHEPETHLIPLTIKAALGRIKGLALYGTDYDTADGTAVRDYVHVQDLAAGHVSATRYLLDGGASDALNLGNDQGYSVREIIAAVEAHTGCPVPVTETARRSGDAACLIADSSRARAALDWRTPLSDLETIISSAANWERRRSAPPAAANAG